MVNLLSQHSPYFFKTEIFRLKFRASLLSSLCHLSFFRDPNRPISASIPWPSFTKDNEIFLEFNSKGIQEITTPHKDRLDKLLTTIFSARKQQVAADKAPGMTHFIIFVAILRSISEIFTFSCISKYVLVHRLTFHVQTFSDHQNNY